jgi:hypothetical protein
MKAFDGLVACRLVACRRLACIVQEGSSASAREIGVLESICTSVRARASPSLLAVDEWIAGQTDFSEGGREMARR